MKYIIASDIHGSHRACERLLENYEKENADKLILLGDLFYHGPLSAVRKLFDNDAIADMLNAIKDNVICVRGNCDADSDQAILSFPFRHTITQIDLGGKTMFITHGHVYNEYNLPPISHGDILLHGHTHVQKCVDNGDYLYMNPGSTSLPRDNSAAGFMTLCDGVFCWKDLDGNETLPRYSMAESVL